MHPFVAAFADELVKTSAAKSMLTPKSTNVKGWRYDGKNQELFVTFRSGGTYRYDEVPRSVARALRRNKSAGSTIHKWVKTPGFAYEKVANGDMLQYFADHPDKLREKQKRDAAKARRKMVKKGNAPNVLEGMTQKRRAIAKMAGAAKRQVTWQGLTMKLEYEAGDVRSGVNGATGKSWSRKMSDHYGYMPGTFGKGADGEAIDVYFNPDAGDELAKVVYKIRQKKKTGEYDEDKFMVGYASGADAKKAFLRNMPEWAFGSMMSMSMDGFKKLVGQ
jgi:hypothetical protein